MAMAWRARVLVMANVTATSDELLDALRERGDIAVTLLMPAAHIGFAGRKETQGRLEETLAVWRAAGIDATGEVGDCDPAVAMQETWDPRRFDEVILSTLPSATSRWLRSDLPRRVAKITDMQVAHVVARVSPIPRSGPPRRRERPEFGALTLRSPRQH